MIAAIVALLVWGTFSFGAVYQWAYVPMLIGAALMGTGAWLNAGQKCPPRAVLVSATFTIAAILLQVWPLSSAQLQELSPSTDRLLRQIDLLYSTSPEPVHAVSLSPPLTLIASGFLAALSIFTIGISRWLTRERLTILVAAISCLGLMVAFQAIVQQAVSPGYVYGKWRSVFGGDPFGPFINKNHFAGWQIMVLPLSLGLAMGLTAQTKQRSSNLSRRLLDGSWSVTAGFLLFFGSIVMCVSLLLSFSRSGVISAALALVLAAGASGKRSDIRWQVAGAISLLLVGVLWVGPGAVIDRFMKLGAGTIETRLGIWQDTLRMVTDFPLTGVGIRAFQTANLHYQTVLSDLHVNAAHNDWLQLAAEGGLLVGVPALALLTSLVRESIQRFRAHHSARDLGRTYWVRVGAITGILAICIQSTVEFSLQIPVNTLLFALLWSIAIAPLTEGVKPITHNGV